MKRTLALGAAWITSAVAAVGLGFLAVSLLDASASPGIQQVAAGTSPSSSSASPTGASPVAPSGEQVTVGGTVYASCAGGAPDLASAPAPGWWIDDSAALGAVEFTDGAQKIEVRTVCVGGGAQFSVEGPRTDDGGRDDRPARPTAPAPGSPSTGSGADDSSGRHGGGHGSDG